MRISYAWMSVVAAFLWIVLCGMVFTPEAFPDEAHRAKLDAWEAADIASWPMFRHDPMHSGNSHQIGAQNSDLRWRFSTGGPIHSSPAIGADGTVYIGSDKIYAVKTDGTLLWEFSSAESISFPSSPAVDFAGTVYIGSEGGVLYALHPDGTLKWAFRTGGPLLSSPTVGFDGTIYLGSSDHFLYALTADGTLKWRFETGAEIMSSPAVYYDGTVYVGSMDGKLYAILSDGTLKWKTIGDTGHLSSSPAISREGIVYVGSADEGILGFGKDGQRIWNFPTEAPVSSSPAIGHDGTVYVGAEDGTFYALSPQLEFQWLFQASGAITSSPAVGSDGTLYFGSRDHKVYALRRDGALNWTFTTEGTVESSPAIGRDGMMICIGSHDFGLYAIGLPVPYASLLVTPPILRFGRTPAGEASRPLRVTLRNVGQDELHVTGMLLSDPADFILETSRGREGAESFGRTDDCGTLTPVLAPGASCNVYVTFHPNQEGLFRESLTIYSNDPKKPLVKAPLWGSSLSGPQPRIFVYPRFHSFGDIQAGTESPPLNVTILNAGSTNLKVTDIRLSDHVNFQLDPKGDVNSCGSLNPLLAPGDYCNVTLRFTPSSPGSSVTRLRFASNDPFNPTVSPVYTGTGESSDVASVTIQLPGASTTNPSESAYRMIGIPVLPQNPDTFDTLAPFFGGMYNPALWRLFDSSGTLEITGPAQDDIEYGKAWWTVSTYDKTMTITGAPLTSDFVKGVSREYQIIACPFATRSVTWSNVVTDPANSVLGLGDQLFYWDGGPDLVAVPAMEPGKAYWVWASRSGNLVIKRYYNKSPTEADTLINTADVEQPPPPPPPGAFIEVLSPGKEHRFRSGSIFTIRWRSMGISPEGFPGTVDIAVSADGGNSYTTIATRVVNQGTYEWKVPNKMVSSRCLIRVTSSLYPGLSGVSGRYFSIR